MNDQKAPLRWCYADDALFEQHVAPPGHPERAERLRAARQGFEQALAPNLAERLPARDASFDELGRVHEGGYLEALGRTSGRSGYLDADTFFSPRSFDVARRASGAALAIADALLDGRADFGFGLLRPPGHHARPAAGMGFCLLNHVAVAARHALDRGARRVAIIDWDVHHGNGTEEIFESAADVLYVSLHQSPQYPGTGAESDVGSADGRGYTVNIPLAAGADRAVYTAAFERVVLPIVEQFAPDLTLVSAGFDAHARDPLGGMQLDGDSYATLARRLFETVRGGPSQRIGFLLEGGYDLQGLRESVQDTVAGLGAPATGASSGPLGAAHEAGIAAAARAQREFWRLG